ncbi:unnamed protein product [Diabrotica balteata]|uniref:Uncharacterized protein n=1 Tax=Diabrotica balteata TaxID=107213 RepID=A0A9N9XGK7_DIABA|nr:unnamed protein product [Diabrotica balteata]
MKSLLLSCQILDTNHTAVSLAQRLKDVVNTWGLNKITLTVSGNASNIVNAVTEQLNWKHLGCVDVENL